MDSNPLELWVALPSTLLMEDRDLRDKTLKIGAIARALGIYGVSKVIVFKDPVETSVDDSNIIIDLLRYIETPPYLRKKLYPLIPRLSFAGLLPPLKIPSHKPKIGMNGLQDGEIREAVVEQYRGMTMADVGVEAPIPYDGQARLGSRVTVLIHRFDRQLQCEKIDKSKLEHYWGFEVKEQRQLEPLLKDGRLSLSIATSRKGVNLSEVWNDLSSSLKKGGKVLLIFGAPKRGLLEMYPKQFLQDNCDFILNTVPFQQTETVRTEEALLVTLSVISVATSV